jgi:uncharacterized protein YecE (DUF72 family)
MNATGNTPGESGAALYGLAGWNYKDWAGIVYPSPPPRGFEPIRYLARFFQVLEINSSFYRIPSVKSTASWAGIAEPIDGFEFTMKLWQGFTHRRTELDEQGAQAFEAAADPLFRAGKLGSILLQFPWSFRRNPQSEEWLKRLLGRFSRFPLTVEIRHSTWFEDDAIFRLLAGHGAAFCNIDQPALRDCIGLTDRATADHAYIRFHGRNRASWFKETASGAERYDYLYSGDEIGELAKAVKTLKQSAKRVYVITNNHWRGQAAANALQIQSEAEGKQVEAPASLLNEFPNLGPLVINEAPRGGDQLEMF